MVLKQSIPLLLMLLPALLPYGCTPRPDLAPVVTDEQRNRIYRLPTISPGPDSDGGNQTSAGIEQNAIDDNQKDNYSEPLEKKKQKNNQGSGPLLPEKRYHEVKEGETLFSLGAQTGYGYEKLALWNNIPPPYQITKGQTILLFNSAPEAQAVFENIDTNQKVVDSDPNRNYKPVNSGDTKKKADKQTFSKPSRSDYNSERKKKKSTDSIDNKNMLMLSFQWPLKGRISKQFSQTDQKGIDIAGKSGQSVQASEAGKVVYSGQGLIGFGNLLIIKHNNEYLSAYANNGDLFVKEGQHVSKGQDIAKLGMSVSKRAFLHFEIRKNGKPVNPLSLLPVH